MTAPETTRIRYLLLHAYGMGGTIRTVINQANAMAAAGHEVEIVSVVRRRERPQFEIDPRIRLLTLSDQREGRPVDSTGRRVWRWIRGRIVPAGEFAASYFTERVERAVIDYVSALTGGVLVTTRPALNLISARRAPAGIVKVGQEHMNLATHPEAVRSEIGRHYGKLDAVVVLTETDRREYQELLPGTRVERVPNAVCSVRRTPSRKDDRLVVAAGRLVGQKGFDLLIPAFRRVVDRHPDWRLRIYGTGKKKGQLCELLKEHGLGDNVTLMGRTGRLDEELARASFYVLSSRFEGLPMVMIEAMTHGLPVVAFDCPTGPADVLTPEVDGLLVPPCDVDALAAAMVRLIEDRELRRRMGAAAAVAAHEYTPETVMPLWEKLFAELLDRGSKQSC
ncbi:glycosyltransferase family 4 protein [Streptosporangium amethystogenes]|uniref:glycosyltransferase family 4 protein n=1 Tax=Streptosporangium amethystogenes TaxID=2002 RepID=UPI0004C86556|nr:glycosyltransferase family 4 protein [Streptosporangium amethystogenes]